MCELCIRHGEGKKWYEVMQNYSQELYQQKNREEFARQFIKGTQTTTVDNINRMIKFKKKLPIAYRFYRKAANLWSRHYHFGQVVPLEDAEMIVDMVQSVTRIPCICRSAVKGKKDARYCFALGIDPTGLFGDFPDLKIHLETLTAQETKELLRQFDKEGLVHSIWTFKTPFIGAICNCDRDCLAYKTQIAEELAQVMFKAEYTASIDILSCMGCKQCMKACQFGAIEFSTLDNKCYINELKCYGCGLCRQACTKQAINFN